MDSSQTLAELIADILEANGAHPWDQGFTEALMRDGYTEAGRLRLIEQLRRQHPRVVAAATRETKH